MMFLLNVILGIPLFIIIGAFWLIQMVVVFTLGLLFTGLGKLAGHRIKPITFSITIGFLQ